jgi:cysteine desulfurase
MKTIYLDNCATTQVDIEVVEKINEIMLNNYGNPSSLHFKGSDAYNALGTARCQVASVISAKTSDIIFTSSGTESNNIAIIGGTLSNEKIGKHIVTTTIEHSSVIQSINQLEKKGYSITRVAPNKNTHLIKAEDIINAVTDETAIVSFMHVNNETGEILPVKDIVTGIRAKNSNTLIHCDCVQSFGKHEFKLFNYKVDMLSASAHKLHGPKGIGMLYVRDISRIKPLIFGGMQEKGIKPGTENTSGICGFGQAALIALLKYKENIKHIQTLKNKLLNHFTNHPNIHINSPEYSVPNILNISVLGKTSEEIVNYFSMHNIYVSGSSACKKGDRSHVLLSAGYDDEIVNGSLRISFSKYNTVEEVDEFIEVFDEFMGTCK